MFSNSEYLKAAEKFFRSTPEGQDSFLKFFSDDLVKKVAREMLSSTPTILAAKLALARLVARGEVERVDGLTGEEAERVDAAEAEAKHKSKVNAAFRTAQSVELAKHELDEFVQMSRKDVEERWRSDLYFRARYILACRNFGFQSYGLEEES